MKKKFYREAHGYKTDEEMIDTLKETKVEIPIMEKLEKEVIEEIVEEPKKEGKKKNGRKFII